MTKQSLTRCFLISGFCLTLSSCFGTNESSAQKERNADTPAGKLGQAAHTVAKHTEHAAAVVERKLGEAAHQAHDGWDQAAKQDHKK